MYNRCSVSKQFTIFILSWQKLTSKPHVHSFLINSIVFNDLFLMAFVNFLAFGLFKVCSFPNEQNPTLGGTTLKRNCCSFGFYTGKIVSQGPSYTKLLSRHYKTNSPAEDLNIYRDACNTVCRKCFAYVGMVILIINLDDASFASLGVSRWQPKSKTAYKNKANWLNFLN